MKELYLSDEVRGVDPLALSANDCNRFQNSPRVGRIPRWWLEEGTVEQVREWERQIESGEVEIE